MTDYGRLSKTLHALALGEPLLAETALDIELAAFDKKLPDVTSGNHIFVAGFARAGTTVLTRSLYNTGQFGSLTYRDMPFVLAPNFWSRVSKFSSRKMIKRERIHGDGIYVDYDSPEAFDEVFWKVCMGDDYIKRFALKPHHSDPSMIEKYQKYVAAILYRYGERRYLSKNNNNILRIRSIVEAFPNSFILVPFRAPLQQSASLLKQHVKLLRLQQQDPFIERYMNWLGHHEFGKGHKPFELTGTRCHYQDTQSIEYWLDQWLMTYRYLLDSYDEFNRQMIPICYEQLCDDSKRIWESLLQRIGVENSQRPPKFSLPKTYIPNSFDHDQLAEAEDVYHNLCSWSGLTLVRSKTTT